MTPLEELQAAHKRLGELRDTVNTKQVGTYWGNIDEDPTERAEVFCAHGVVAETVSNEHADLIVMLHRTIEAQLHIIAEAILVHARHWEHPRKYKLDVSDDAMELARAINGEAS